MVKVNSDKKYLGKVVDVKLENIDKDILIGKIEPK